MTSLDYMAVVFYLVVVLYYDELHSMTLDCNEGLVAVGDKDEIAIRDLPQVDKSSFVAFVTHSCKLFNAKKSMHCSEN